MKNVALVLVVLTVSEYSFVEPSRRWIHQNIQNEKSFPVKSDCERDSLVVGAVNALEHRHYFFRSNRSRSRRMGSTKTPPLSEDIHFSMSVSTSLCSSSNADVDEILCMDARTLSKAIQEERSVTCEQLMKATLDRIEEINPTLNAIILLRDRDDLLHEAKSHDQRLKEMFERDECSTTNINRTKNLGWLYGIPVAIKDVSNVQNFPTTMGGSPLFCHDLTKAATVSDPYVENMILEGAIIIGKTNAPEGGLGSNTFNDLWGKTLNPLAVEASISAGGSSGGAAVAVTTKMLAVADGTDNMGSLRNPAGWNNIYSLRPTAGLIPGATSSFLPHPASTPGPMARTPRDCAWLLQSMVRNTDAFDAESLWNEPKSLHTTTSTIRIGWLGDWNGHLPMEDGILSTCQKALEDWSEASKSTIVLENLSTNQSLFNFDKLWEAYNTIRFASTLETYSQRFDVDSLLASMKTAETQRPMKEELAWELEQGKSIDTNALANARAIYDEYEEWLSGIFAQTSKADTASSFLALPSAQVWPFPIEDRYPRTISGTKMDTYHRWMEVCVPVSLGGLPCVTIPAGFGRNHEAKEQLPPLPIGIQLFGKGGDDGKLLRLADEYYHYRSESKES